MKPISLVRANVLVPFVAFLEEAGAPAERMMRGAGLPPEILENPERLVPLHQCLVFAGHVADAEHLPDFGLLVGLRSPFDQLGAFARLLLGAATVHEALNRLVSAVPLHDSGSVLTLHIAGDHAAFCHEFTFAGVSGQLQGDLFSLAMMVQAVRALLGPDWMPNGIRLPFRHEPYRKQHEAALHVPVVCSGDRSVVLFRSSALAAQPYCISHDPARDDFDFLRVTGPENDFLGSLRQVIAALLSAGYPDIQRTANAIGLSVRTLQRQLAAGGESYSHMVEDVRFATAARLLRNTDIKLVDIAWELGYADPANFSRAFRRWAGIPPRDFRQKQC